jgi:hypothetical protein
MKRVYVMMHEQSMQAANVEKRIEKLEKSVEKLGESVEANPDGSADDPGSRHGGLRQRRRRQLPIPPLTCPGLAWPTEK